MMRKRWLWTNLNNRCKVVIQDDDIRTLFSHFCSSYSHSKTNICLQISSKSLRKMRMRHSTAVHLDINSSKFLYLMQGRSIICPISSDCNNMTTSPQRLHQQKLVIGRWTAHNLQTWSNQVSQLLYKLLLTIISYYNNWMHLMFMEDI